MDIINADDDQEFKDYVIETINHYPGIHTKDSPLAVTSAYYVDMYNQTKEVFDTLSAMDVHAQREYGIRYAASGKARGSGDH